MGSHQLTVCLITAWAPSAPGLRLWPLPPQCWAESSAERVTRACWVSEWVNEQWMNSANRSGGWAKNILIPWPLLKWGSSLFSEKTRTPGKKTVWRRQCFTRSFPLLAYRRVQLSWRLCPWPGSQTPVRSQWLGAEWRVSSKRHQARQGPWGPRLLPIEDTSFPMVVFLGKWILFPTESHFSIKGTWPMMNLLENKC